MAFTSWSAFRTAIKDAIMTLAEGEPFAADVAVRDKRITIRSIEEAMEWIKRSYEMEGLENIGTPSVTISYGRHRRFR